MGQLSPWFTPLIGFWCELASSDTKLVSILIPSLYFLYHKCQFKCTWNYRESDSQDSHNCHNLSVCFFYHLLFSSQSSASSLNQQPFSGWDLCHYMHFLPLPRSPLSHKRLHNAGFCCNETEQSSKGEHKHNNTITSSREYLENNTSSGCSKLHLFFFCLSIFVLYGLLQVLMTKDILSIPELEMC